MTNKRKLLFVIPSLHAGGGEKALVNLLNELHPDRYDIDLLLFSKTGLFLEQIPATVNIIQPQGAYAIFSLPLGQSVTSLFLKGKWTLAIARIQYAQELRKHPNAAIAEQQAWKYWRKCMPTLEPHYDVAIGFLEKSSIYYIVDKVNATKKIGWIHTAYAQSGLDATFDNTYFNQLDALVGVSEQCINDLIEAFPSCEDKITEIPNLISKKMLLSMAEAKVSLSKSNLDIITVARMSEEKGMELLVATAKILKEKGVAFVWYLIGDGPMKSWIEKEIQNLDLSENLILLGLQNNPYKFIKWADVYCQPSKFEGKSIAIDEAKLLAKPIIATNFSTVHDQLTHNQNAYIVDMTPEAVAEGIIFLYQNKDLTSQFTNNLKDFSLNENEILKKIECVMNE
jgi:glycosyltransferase involved in cell wall biosynthesis